MNWATAGQAATVVTAVVIVRQIIIWGRKPNRPAPESQESEQDRLREEAAHAPHWQGFTTHVDEHETGF